MTVWANQRMQRTRLERFSLQFIRLVSRVADPFRWA